jgi:hypothetical protein
MKNAPINLPLLPEWMLHFNGQPTRQGFEAQDYARAAILADRSAASAEPTREVLMDVTAHLVAAVSLLEGGGKKSAWSDKVFYQMIEDYKASIERGRAFLAAPSPAEPPAAPVQQEPVAWRRKVKMPLGYDKDCAWKEHWAFAARPSEGALGKPPIEWEPLYTHPDADLRAELAEAKAQWAKWSGLYEHELENCERAEAERDSLRTLLQHLSDAFHDVNWDGGLCITAGEKWDQIVDAAIAAAPSPAEPKPDRAGMVYYKRNECTAASADSPDCICWSPAAPEDFARFTGNDDN